MRDGPVALDVAFKTPIFLPASVAFVAHDEGSGVRFALRTADGVKPHLTGHLAPATTRGEAPV